MYGLELIIIIFATLAQALSSGSPGMDVIGVIIFWRVLMVGGPREEPSAGRPPGGARS